MSQNETLDPAAVTRSLIDKLGIQPDTHAAVAEVVQGIHTNATVKDYVPLIAERKLRAQMRIRVIDALGPVSNEPASTEVPLSPSRPSLLKRIFKKG